MRSGRIHRDVGGQGAPTQAPTRNTNSSVCQIEGSSSRGGRTQRKARCRRGHARPQRELVHWSSQPGLGTYFIRNRVRQLLSAVQTGAAWATARPRHRREQARARRWSRLRNSRIDCFAGPGETECRDEQRRPSRSLSTGGRPRFPRPVPWWRLRWGAQSANLGLWVSTWIRGRAVSGGAGNGLRGAGRGGRDAMRGG